MLEVDYKNWVITLVPTAKPAKERDILAFAGIAKGIYDDTKEEIDAYLAGMRDEWER